MFFVSIINIKKVLIARIKIDLRIKLLEYYFEFLSAFDYLKVKKLLLFRNYEINYIIKLEKVNKKELIIL